MHRGNSLRNHPLYEAAKHGADYGAAQEIINDLMNADTLFRIETDIGKNKPRIVVPSLTRYDPQNVLPIVFAQSLGVEFGLDVETEIFEVEGKARTCKDGFYRLTKQPAFTANNIPFGQTYIVADDVCTLGGTIANLAQFIQHSGGKVLSITTLADGTASKTAKQRRTAEDFLLNISRNHMVGMEEHFGDEFEKFLHEQTGLKYGMLTDREAEFLLWHKDDQELVKRQILQGKDAPVAQTRTKRR